MQETGEYQRCIYVQQQEQEQEQEDEGEPQPQETAVVVGGGDDIDGAGIDPAASGNWKFCSISFVMQVISFLNETITNEHERITLVKRYYLIPEFDEPPPEVSLQSLLETGAISAEDFAAAVNAASADGRGQGRRRVIQCRCETPTKVSSEFRFICMILALLQGDWWLGRLRFGEFPRLLGRYCS